MFRYLVLGFGSLLTLGTLTLSAAPPARPKPPPVAVKPAATPPFTLPDGGAIKMAFHNGAVLKTVEIQTIFIGDWSKANPNLKSQLNNAVDVITSGAYLDALARYGVGHGARDATVALPLDFVNHTMDDSELQKLIPGWIGRSLKPLDANRLYLFFLPPGVQVTPWAVNSNSGYHGSFSNGSQQIPIPYAVINTSGSLNGMTSVTSHEIAESVTNPTGGGFYSESTSAGVQEIADFTDGPTIGGKVYPYLGASLNGVQVQLVLNPDGFVIQVPGAAPDRIQSGEGRPAGAGASKSKPR